MASFIRPTELDSKTERWLIAMEDPLFLAPVHERVVELNERLHELVALDRNLTAAEWVELETFEREADRRQAIMIAEGRPSLNPWAAPESGVWL